MRVIIYGINYSPELTGIGKYSGEMGEWLTAQGIELKVVTAPPYYPDWKVFKGYKKYWFDKEKVDGFELIRCPTYVPSHPSTIKRLLHLVSFAFTSLFALFSLSCWKPDIVITIVPTAFSTPGSLLFSKVTGAKNILHVQDFEFDAMLGSGMMSKSVYSKPLSLITKLVNKVERFSIKRFDKVSSISRTMLNKAIEKGAVENQLVFLPNWVDIDFINPTICRNECRKKWGFSEVDKIILYSGNIGKKQGLEILIDVAKNYQSNSNIKFVIVGDGAYKRDLTTLAVEAGLSNLIFKDLVPYNHLPYLLAMADIHLVIQKSGVADAVLPSKLTGILAAGGHVLITAEKDTELGMLNNIDSEIAEIVEPENLHELINGLDKLLKRNTNNVNTSARNYAEQFLSKQAILSNFKSEIENLILQS